MNPQKFTTKMLKSSIELQCGRGERLVFYVMQFLELSPTYLCCWWRVLSEFFMFWENTGQGAPSFRQAHSYNIIQYI